MDYRARDAKESTIGTQSLDILYPLPPAGTLFPPGLASEGGSARALLRALRHNHEHHHAYINPKWFHKYASSPLTSNTLRLLVPYFITSHAAHHMLAIYPLGCSARCVERAYKAHDNLTPAYESPEPITDANLVEHLGKERFKQFHTTISCRRSSTLTGSMQHMLRISRATS